MSQEKLNFKVSSALKDIIGRDLITDDFVAIFELVKNSFDANAKRVDVIFENPLSGNGKIIIADNGKGMDLDDIKEKWLFVAYSAKKDGSENYRDEIKSKRIHAGAKGIGRFSCDRLGEKLTIYSRRHTDDKISKLSVDWQDFEKNMQSKFDQITVSYEEIDHCDYSFEKGTVLEISNARSIWEAEKIRTLRQSLEKLINPSQSNTKSDFSIYLKADEFKHLDIQSKKNGNPRKVINGKITNFLFEKLDLKSTSIRVEIDKNGEVITTELLDRGHFIYRMAEENPYKNEDWSLSNIKVHLFALNTNSKSTFTKHMGIRPVQFGSVFVYKNGFRIHPIGEIGRGDVFGLDGRKQQGTSRYFGTRDLIGRIEIDGDNDEFKEASSRDGGLARNTAFNILKDFFIDHALRRLERFSIDVTKYGNIDNFDEHNNLSDSFPKDKALAFIETLTKSDTIHDIEFNPEIFDIVSNASEKSLKNLLKNLNRIAIDADAGDISNEIKKIESRLDDLTQASRDAEKEAIEEKKRRIEAEKTAIKEAEKARAAEIEAQTARETTEQKTKESIFLRSISSADHINIVALHHHIGIAAGTIENYVRSVSNRIRSGKPITTDSFLNTLDEISFVARQISATTKFATKANFNLEAEVIKKDLTDYIIEYAMNICSGLIRVKSKSHEAVKFECTTAPNSSFEIKFRPLEISMVLDGLINNSVKAGATTIQINCSVTDNELTVLISDNGTGIPNKVKDQIYDMGFTTTSGSGLGLHHIRNILQDMRAHITLKSSSSTETTFELKFTR